MAISINWNTKVITVPKSDTQLVSSGPPEVRQLNIDTFRLVLKSLEASEEGILFETTHIHNPPVTVGGTVLARVIEIINGYTVTFEAGAYAVNLVGANSNIGDVINFNTVQVRSSNSVGLVQITQGSGVLESDVTAIKNAVWGEALPGSYTTGQAGNLLTQAQGLTEQQATQLRELWQLQGLDLSNPMTISQVIRQVSGVNLSITSNPNGSVTLQRV